MKDEGLEAREIRPGSYQRVTIPWWFVLGSILVAVISAYYIYRFWGGLGPGVLP